MANMEKEMSRLDEEILTLERKTLDLYAVGRIKAALKLQDRAAYLRRRVVEMEIADASVNR